MSVNPAASTLYEDWQARRDRLAGSLDRDEAIRKAELRLLNFLLRQYRGQSGGAARARFPIRGNIFVDRRAIVVHWHLGKGYLPEIHTRHAAEERIRTVVDRMAAGESSAGPLFNPAAIPPFNERLEAIRGRLCENDADARLAAIVDLGRFGTLDDIALISDLLALPPQDDEDPFERHVLLTAMKKIIKRADWRSTSREDGEPNLSAHAACGRRRL